MKHLLITLALCGTFFFAAAQDDELAGRFLANRSWVGAEGHSKYSSDPRYQGRIMQFAIAVKVSAAGRPENVVLFDKDPLLDSILTARRATAEILQEKEAFKNCAGSIVICYVTLQSMQTEPRNAARNPDPSARAKVLDELKPYGSVRIIDPFIVALGQL